jgi:type IV pilus assembly protein PilM
MAKPTAVWGLDLGQCALKAIKLELVDGKPTATAFDYIEHPKIMSQPDADPEALTREAIEKFLSRNPLKNDLVAVSIAGQSGGLARFVKLPPVEESRIPDIVRFEAKQQIPFPLEDVVWDYQTVAGGEVINNFAMETEVGLFAMKRELIARHLAQYGSSGVECHVVQMAPLALTNFATYELLKKGGVDAPMLEDDPNDDTPRGKKRCVVVLDVGTDASNLIITDAGKIIWQRPLAIGGNHFTRALTKEMKLTFAKAEHLKRNAAKSPDLAQILKALRPILTDFVGEVQRSLGYFTNTHRDAHIAHLVGLGSAFKLPGLQKYMAEKLSLEVKRPSSFARLSGDVILSDPVFSENILTFPVAYGLALQALNLLGDRNDYGRLRTNLLPKEVQVERQIRAKKPFAAAAAAAMLFGIGLAAIGFGVQYTAANDPNIKKAADSAESSIGEAGRQTAEKTKREEELKKAQDEVKLIQQGVDRRLDWVRMHQFISIALPRHGENGNLLTDDQQVQLWNTERGRPAMKAYEDRVKRGLSIDRINDPDMSEYLAQVNIHEIRTRYTDNLKNVYENAETYKWKVFSQSLAVDMLESEREKDEAVPTRMWKVKAPEGGGWVFEVRGSTFHEQGSRFLINAVVRNFQKFGLNYDPEGAKKFTGYSAGAADPVAGRISHVGLVLAKKPDNPSQDVTAYIAPSVSFIDSYLGAPGAAGGGGMMGGPGMEGMMGGMMGGAPGGGSADAGGGGTPGTTPAKWQPLVGSGGSGGGSGYYGGDDGGGMMGGGMMGGGPSPGGVAGGLGGGMAAGGPGGGRGGGPGVDMGGPPGGSADGGRAGEGFGGADAGASGGQTTIVTGKGTKKQRTVFVLIFTWRDPAGSSPNSGDPSAAGAAPAAAPAAPAAGGK